MLARWGAKTGYSLIAAEKEGRNVIPLGQASMLRQEGQVSPLTWVGYMSWIGKAVKMVEETKEAHSEIGGNVGPTGPLLGLQAILCFGHVALRVFVMLDPLPPGHVLRSDEAFRQVSPALQRSISWPTDPPAYEQVLLLLWRYLPIRPAA